MAYFLVKDLLSVRKYMPSKESEKIILPGKHDLIYNPVLNGCTKTGHIKIPALLFKINYIQLPFLFYIGASFYCIIL
jgi:hypothetical protein